MRRSHRSTSQIPNSLPLLYVYKLYTGENNLPIMLMYSNEIQIPLNIQHALFYFQNDKLLSLAAVIARYAYTYTLRTVFYYSFSSGCAGFLASRRGLRTDVLLAPASRARRQLPSFVNSPCTMARLCGVLLFMK